MNRLNSEEAVLSPNAPHLYPKVKEDDQDENKTLSQREDLEGNKDFCFADEGFEEYSAGKLERRSN